MGEYKRGKLKSSSGRKVTNRKQAVAIALSEALHLARHNARNAKGESKWLNKNLKKLA
jgi:hypothetical protein